MLLVICRLHVSPSGSLPKQKLPSPAGHRFDAIHDHHQASGIAIDEYGSRGDAKAFDSPSRFSCRGTGCCRPGPVCSTYAIEPWFPPIAWPICCAATAQESCPAEHARTYVLYRIVTAVACVRPQNIESHAGRVCHGACNNGCKRLNNFAFDRCSCNREGKVIRACFVWAAS